MIVAILYQSSNGARFGFALRPDYEDSAYFEKKSVKLPKML